MFSFRSTARLFVALAFCCITQAARALDAMAPTPLATIYPGDVIAAGAIELRPFAPALVEGGQIVLDPRQLFGRVARRTLLPGQPIPVFAVGDANTVRAGAPVAIRYVSGALRMQTSGQALQSGAVGARIKVRNADSGRVIEARVEPDGSVLVGDN